MLVDQSWSPNNGTFTPPLYHHYYLNPSIPPSPLLELSTSTSTITHLIPEGHHGFIRKTLRTNADIAKE